MRATRGERRSRAWPRPLCRGWPSSPGPRPPMMRAPRFGRASIRRNLPFANDKGEGFENRIADLFAEAARGAGAELLVPAADELHPQHAALQAARRGLPLRHRHERAGDVRPGAADGAVLPFDVCARIPQGPGPRRREVAAPTCSRCRRTCATSCGSASTTARPPRSGSCGTGWKRRQAVSDDVAGSRAVPGRDHRKGSRAGQHRRRGRLGSDRRLLREARAQVELVVIPLQVGARREVRLRDRDGRARRASANGKPRWTS